jgi:integrase
MARGIERLSPLFPQRVKKPGFYADGAGLYLQVTEGAPNENGKRQLKKSWCFRFMLAGRAREMGLGPFHDYTLSEARDRAREGRRLVREGIDPIERRKAQIQAKALEAARSITFQAAAEQFIELHKAGWTHKKSAEQWTSSLRNFVYPVFGSWPVQSVDTAAVLKAIEPLWLTKTTTAARTRGRIENILDWAATRGFRSKGHNPAEWSGHLEHSLPRPSTVKTVEGHAAIPYQELGAFVQKLRADPATSARALEFLILTACRTAEILGTRWSEIDFDARSWTVPSERMKGVAGKRRQHRVPLSDAAMAILSGLRKVAGKSAFVFPGRDGRGPFGLTALDTVMRRMDISRERASVHGMRSTFSTWAAERMASVPREIAEQALAHTTAGAVEKAYQRSDHFERRRHLMDAWAAYIAQPETSAEVVRFNPATAEATG